MQSQYKKKKTILVVKSKHKRGKVNVK